MKFIPFSAVFALLLFFGVYFYSNLLTQKPKRPGQIKVQPNPKVITSSVEAPTEQIPKLVLISVPFSPQAPFAQWKDPREQDGCEEAAAMIAMHWVENKPLSQKESKAEILTVSHFQSDTYGLFVDTSAKDTLARIITGYYHYPKAFLIENVSLEQIIAELDRGNILITPMNGRALKNPHFTQPGPERHMVVIRGYDPMTKEIITNDPGIAQGENYRYPEDIFYNAIRDYPTGDHVPITEIKKVAIVVSR